MSTHVYDHAYELEKSLRNSEAFINLKEMFEAVMADPPSKEIFDQFRETQMNLQEKQMQGIEITEQEVADAQAIVDQVQQHELITKLMDAEQHLNVVINEISQIITKPLEELYGMTDQ